MGIEANNEKHAEMMRQGEGVKVRLTDRNGKTSEGEVRLQRWDKKMRTKRAVKFWAICWVAAVFAVFLPIVHFVLVPGLLLGGIGGAIFMSGQESVILGGESHCPNCNEFFVIVRSADRWPLSDQCSKCQTPVTIERADTLQGQAQVLS